MAQGIQTFAIAADTDPPQLHEARLVFEYATRRMWQGDGRLLFQRQRFWTNRVHHMRCVQSPMLRALARVHLADERA